MHILHILDHSAPLHSGYTQRTLAILAQQRALGWSTSHLTGAKQGPTAAPEQDVDGWHFFRTAPASGRWSTLPLLRQWSVVAGLSRRLRQVALAQRPDILHAHSPALNALAALRVGRALGIPVVYEIRAFWEDAAVDHGSHRHNGLRYRLVRALDSYAMRRADAVTTICDGLRRDLLGRGIAAAKITVIPNAVTSGNGGALSDASVGTGLARRLGLEQHRVIGFIGSFYAYEGLALLLRALPAMLAGCPALRVLLVGGGPQETALRALAVQLGVGPYVIFAGQVAHAQVNQYYRLIDVLVYPRLPMRLTELVTPLKPLEAMAQGRLVLASNVGGHRELITDGVTGVLFAAGDGAALAATVLDLLSHTERWPVICAAARAYVARERNWYASVARYAAIYTRLIGARRP